MSKIIGYSFSDDGDIHEYPSLTRASASSTFLTAACLIFPFGADWSVTLTFAFPKSEVKLRGGGCLQSSLLVRKSECRSLSRVLFECIHHLIFCH